MPTPIRFEDFTSNLFTLLIETFESPPRPFSAYLDQNTGLFDTLSHLSAEQASQPTTEGGTSIAAQVKHLKYYIEVFEQFLDSKKVEADWHASWQPKEVTPEAWETLKQDLETTYQRLKRKLESIETWNDDAVGDSMAIVVHTAYHLGAIRQIGRTVM